MSYLLCVTGSRKFDDWDFFVKSMNKVLADRGRPFKVMHGGAPGADAFASRWAHVQRLDLDIHGAQWGQFGSSAGPIRNRVMASRLMEGDLLVAFPLGESKGTWNMVSQVMAEGRSDVKVFRVDDD